MELKDLKQSMSRFAPWNWFRKEQEQEGQAQFVHRADEASVPAYGATNPMLQLHRDIDRMFELALRGFGQGWPASVWPDAGAAWQGMLRPAVDIRETDSQYLVSVEIPGVDEKDIEVTLDGDLLVIRGEKRHEHEHQEGQYHRVERAYGAFKRVLNLPENADRDAIKARFGQGVLTLTVDKRAGEPAPRGRSIPVES